MPAVYGGTHELAHALGGVRGIAGADREEGEMPNLPRLRGSRGRTGAVLPPGGDELSHGLDLGLGQVEHVSNELLACRHAADFSARSGRFAIPRAVAPSCAAPRHPGAICAIQRRRIVESAISRPATPTSVEADQVNH